MENVYWIVDDVIDESGREGFELMHGDPYSTIGTSQGAYRTRREALSHVPAGEPVYRVFLARRHGSRARVELLRAAS